MSTKSHFKTKKTFLSTVLHVITNITHTNSPDTNNFSHTAKPRMFYIITTTKKSYQRVNRSIQYHYHNRNITRTEQHKWIHKSSSTLQMRFPELCIGLLLLWFSAASGGWFFWRRALDPMQQSWFSQCQPLSKEGGQAGRRTMIDLLP